MKLYKSQEKAWLRCRKMFLNYNLKALFTQANFKLNMLTAAH
ncbi:hypothetical protein [Oxobacter pfennigii]|nr:hypothetical protein [Oxobacter pfennigii]